MVNIQDLCIESNQDIMSCMELLDKNALGIVFVVNKGRLLGSLSDGDIRRAIIAGANNNDNVVKFPNFPSFSWPFKLVHLNLSQQVYR